MHNTSSFIVYTFLCRQPSALSPAMNTTFVADEGSVNNLQGREMTNVLINVHCTMYVFEFIS